MSPQIVRRPAARIVGLQINATPMTPAIGQLWQRFVPRMGEIPQQAEPGASYGVMDRFDAATCTFRYLTGVSVDRVESLPPDMTSIDLVESDYAVFASTLPALGQTFAHIFDTWLPTSGHPRPTSPYFERYGETFDPSDPASVVEVWIPLERGR